MRPTPLTFIMTHHNASTLTCVNYNAFFTRLFCDGMRHHLCSGESSPHLVGGKILQPAKSNPVPGGHSLYASQRVFRINQFVDFRKELLVNQPGL